MPYSVLITGSNRGLGLEFVRQLSSLPDPPRLIFATCRYPKNATELQELQEKSKKSKIHIIKMDTTKMDEIEAAVKQVEDLTGEFGLTLLLNNAGVFSRETFNDISQATMNDAFAVNTTGHISVTQALYPLLKKSAIERGSVNLTCHRAAIVNMCSAFASLDMCTEGKVDRRRLAPTYRASKVALNMMMRALSLQAKEDGILVTSLSPGWTKKAENSSPALDRQLTVGKIITLLERLNETHVGINLDVNTEEPIPW